MRSFDVLVVGELNVDIILSDLPGLPEPGQEKVARKMLYTLGSSSAILAHNLAKLGARVAFAGKIGDDSHGRYVVEALRSVGVDTSGIVVDPATVTGLTVSLSLPSDRALVTYPGAMECFALADIDPSLLERAGHLHVSSYYLQPALRPDLPALFRSAKGFGLTTSLDPGHDPADRWDGIWDLLPFVDVFLPNEEEALRVAACNGLEAAGARLAERAGMVVIKRGMDGAIAWTGTATRTGTRTAYGDGTRSGIENKDWDWDGYRDGDQVGTETVPATTGDIAIGAVRRTGASAGPNTAVADGRRGGDVGKTDAWAGNAFMVSEGYALDALDTTGAGDSFNAGFIRMWLLGRPLHECLEFATACGAISCTYLGGTPGFPDEDGVRRFMDLHRAAHRKPSPRPT